MMLAGNVYTFHCGWHFLQQKQHFLQLKAACSLSAKIAYPNVIQRFVARIVFLARLLPL